MSSQTEQSTLQQLPSLPAWTKAGDDSAAVILTTRVRVARNIAGEHFPSRLNTEGRIRVMRSLNHLLGKLNLADDGVFFSLATLLPIELALLIERRAITPKFMQIQAPRGVFVWKDKDRSLMICEEDHLRVSEILPGLSPRQAFENVKPLLDQLAAELDFAWSDAFGYLTANPANLGEALRTSLFCHLPGLVITKGIDQLASSVADAGFSVRGFWGEGSEVLGNIFQLSDGPALSFDVGNLISRIESLGQEVMEREALARIEIQTRDPIQLKDKIARALAILQTCRVLSAAETLALFSAIRLGLDIGYIQGLKRDTISLLTFELGKAYLDWIGVRDDLGISQQEFRAARVREVFAEAKFVA